MVDDEAVKLAFRTRLLTATGLPAAANRVWGRNARYTRAQNVPYIQEVYTPATRIVKTMPAIGGSVEADGMYQVYCYGLAGDGDAALMALQKAILAVFAPGWSSVLSNGDEVRVRSDIAPTPSDVRPMNDGFTYAVVTVQWRVQSTNDLAA